MLGDVNAWNGTFEIIFVQQKTNLSAKVRLLSVPRLSKKKAIFRLIFLRTDVYTLEGRREKKTKLKGIVQTKTKQDRKRRAFRLRRTHLHHSFFYVI